LFTPSVEVKKAGALDLSAREGDREPLRIIIFGAKAVIGRKLEFKTLGGTVPTHNREQTNIAPLLKVGSVKH
jgi:hypothetical protein